MTRPTSAPQSHVPEDVLVDIALGDQVSTPDHEHLTSCEECHALLDSLRRALVVTRSTAGASLISPPDAVWSRIDAELATDRASRAAAGAHADRHDGAGTEKSAAEEPGSIRRPSARRAVAGRPRTRRPAVAWLAAACIAGVAAGVGGSVVADRLGQSSPRTIATAQLDTITTGESRGVASVQEHDDGLSLEVSARGVTVPDGYAEVWLINRDGKRMVSVGVLDKSEGIAAFPISQALLDEGYVVVDISHEEFDDKPEHSGESLVRGPLGEGA